MEAPGRETVKGLAATLSQYTSVCRDSALATLHRSEFEHAQEARTAFFLIHGHAEALRLLVDAGPGSYPSGWPIARSMLEVGVRTAWRMYPEQPLEAEARWLSWFGRFVEYERRSARAFAKDDTARYFSERAARRAETAESFRSSLYSLLAQRGVETPNGEPSFAQVLRDLGLPPDSYRGYAEASERLHGSFIAHEAYSHDLGTERQHGVFAQWGDWIMPLTLGMRGTCVLAQVFAAQSDSQAMRDGISSALDDWERIRAEGML